MYVETPPSAALRSHVACYWTSRAGGGPRRVLPDGCIDVLLDLVSGRARVVGPMTAAALVHAPRYDVLAVRFRPGEAVGLLGLEVARLTDADLELQDLWGGAANELLERVLETPDDTARLRLFEGALVSRLGTRWADWRVRRAVGLLNEGGLPIPAVAAQVELGERQLERLFLERVGLSPKRFARIARLQRVLPHLGADLATISVLGGFSDSSHVVREVRALCGVTPSSLMSEMSNVSAIAQATAGAR